LNRTERLALPALYTLGAPLITIGIRYGTLHYDVFTPSFFRYVASSGTLVLLCLLSSRLRIQFLVAAVRRQDGITKLS